MKFMLWVNRWSYFLSDSVTEYVIVVNRALLFSLLAMMSVAANGQGVSVSVSTVGQVAYFPQMSAPAAALSLNDVTLSAQIQSTVTDIPVMVADVVDRGDVLVRLDCRTSVAVNQSNQAKLSLAEYQLQRAGQLSEGKHVSEEILRARQSEVAVLRSAVEISTIDVERCVVFSPFRGVVTHRVADVGEWVAQGNPLIQLVGIDDVEVSAQLADSSISELNGVSVFDFVVGERHFPLKLRKVADVVDKTARTREVRLSFLGESAYPGQSGRLVWRRAQRYLPSGFLIRRNDEYGVFVVKDGRAVFVPVPDSQEGRAVRVNMESDALLIDMGRHTVRHNDLVTIRR